MNSYSPSEISFSDLFLTSLLWTPPFLSPPPPSSLPTRLPFTQKVIYLSLGRSFQLSFLARKHRLVPEHSFHPASHGLGYFPSVSSFRCFPNRYMLSSTVTSQCMEGFQRRKGGNWLSMRSNCFWFVSSKSCLKIVTVHDTYTHTHTSCRSTVVLYFKCGVMCACTKGWKSE